MMRILPVCLFVLLLGCGADSAANNAGSPAKNAEPAIDKKEARGEAEDYMGSARDSARIAYSKTDVARKTLTGALDTGGCEFKPDKLKGEYFQVRDVVYNDGKEDLGGAVACEPVKHEELGFAATYFNYYSGGPEVVWYATKQELDDALKAFQSGK